MCFPQQTRQRGRLSACARDTWSMTRSEPIGTFRARVTRDASALERDGEKYFAMNRLEEKHGRPDDRPLFEIQFADGVWMLAREDDLVAGTIGSTTTS